MEHLLHGSMMCRYLKFQQLGRKCCGVFETVKSWVTEQKASAVNNRVAILLGAGSSVAAGFPTTTTLTDQVLLGHGVTRSDDGSYYIDGSVEPPTELLRLINRMVGRLHEEAKRYFSAYPERSTNYEDIYYLARQVSDDLLGETENPAIRCFVEAIKADMSPLVKDANARNENPNEQYEPHVPNDLKELLEETCNYIADVVSKRLLSHCPRSELQPSIIESVCKSTNVTSISTLCHDTHVERFLNSRGVALSDGFSETRPGCAKNGLVVDPPPWNGDFSSNVKTPFLKLHGSVNWFRYDGKIRRIPPHCYPQRIEIDGNYQYAEDGRPQLLIGTFNKISDYSSGIFRELHYRFRSTLSKARILVICGYSFGDKGINEEIIEWVQGENGRRIVVIHPDPSSLVANARGAIQNNWDDWKNSGSISFTEKKFECVDIADFQAAISS